MASQTGNSTPSGDEAQRWARRGAAGRLRSPATRIAAAYAIFATLWILLSDRVLGLLVPDPARILGWGTLKGLAFVAATSVLLWILVHRTFGALERAYRALASRTARLHAHEAEIERLARLLSAIGGINQAIVRSESRDDLERQVCRVLVEEGGFRTAWIGWHDPDTARLVPMAVCGGDADYVRGLRIHTDDRPEGRGPLANAFRQGRRYVCNDLYSDPDTQPWIEEVRARQLRAGAALPLRVDGEVRGLLVVYAGERDFFQQREIALLEEAVGEISFALESFTRQQESRRAEATARSERLFSETMIESTPGVLYLYDEEGRLLRWNRNFEVVSGYSAEEIAGMHPLDFFHEADRPLLRRRIAEVFWEGASSVEAPFRSKDGSSTPYFLTGRRVRFAGRTCLVGMGIDLSERYRAELALRELNETLERRVADRTAELAEARARAETADHAKSAFLATMSHELRTPLNSIIGFTGLILQGLAGPLNAEQSKQLGMVQRSARHLLALINDVLDLSKIEAGQLEVRAEPFELAAVIERTVASMRPLADRKGLELRIVACPDSVAMVSDERRVEQILLNLLNNAIKFTERGSVTLAADVVDDPPATTQEPAREWARIRISDTGIGIRAEDLSRLFRPFQQVDTGLTRQHEGTGLGLVICRRLSALLGGEIVAASEPGRGSEFTCRLPLRATT